MTGLKLPSGVMTGNKGLVMLFLQVDKIICATVSARKSKFVLCSAEGSRREMSAFQSSYDGNLTQSTRLCGLLTNA